MVDIAKVNKSRRQGGLPGWPRLLGGRMCLDFANTVERRLSSEPRDYLRTPGDIDRWAQHSAIPLVDDQSLSHDWEIDSQTNGELSRCLELRETIYRVLLSQLHNQQSSRDLRNLSSQVAEAVGRASYVVTADKVVLTPEPGPAQVRVAVALDAHDLLCGPLLSRVRQCPGCADCGWLFLDTSRNGSRQWCSMEGCGSRAKMRRSYRRGVTGSDR